MKDTRTCTINGKRYAARSERQAQLAALTKERSRAAEENYRNKQNTSTDWRTQCQ